MSDKNTSYESWNGKKAKEVSHIIQDAVNYAKQINDLTNKTYGDFKNESTSLIAFVEHYRDLELYTDKVICYVDATVDELQYGRLYKYNQSKEKWEKIGGLR